MQVIKIEGEGMPIKKSDLKGNLFLIVEVKFPEDDWMQDEAVASKLKELLPKPEPAIETEHVEEVLHNPNGDIEDFGSGADGADGQAWEDDDDEEGHGPQCQQQ